jgi:hypothetical protein
VSRRNMLNQLHLQFSLQRFGTTFPGSYVMRKLWKMLRG